MKCLRTFSMAKRKPALALVGCAAALAAGILLSLLLGAVALSPADMLGALTDPSSAAARILLHVRIPRTCATVLAGVALATAGVIIQSVLGNPLASPNIIGVNAGAGFAVVLVSAFFPASLSALPAAAFVGALVAVLAVYYLARLTGASKITLVLAGVALNSLLGAGTDAVVTLFPDVLVSSSTFRIGGVAGMTMAQLKPAALYIAIAMIAAFALRHDMDVLALGDDTARSLGLRVGVTRFFLLLTAAALAGAAVSFAGLLGFVGLIVPHAARALVGGDSRFLLPVSALMGAALLTLCDVLSRVLFAPYELPVGILMSVIGCPFFFYLLIRRKGGRQHD